MFMYCSTFLSVQICKKTYIIDFLVLMSELVSSTVTELKILKAKVSYISWWGLSFDVGFCWEKNNGGILDFSVSVKCYLNAYFVYMK